MTETRTLDLETVTLARGRHEPDEGAMCAMGREVRDDA